MNLPYFVSQEDDAIRHVASCLLAYSICCQFPSVFLVGGGTNSFGFYYDFVFEQSLTPQLLELIEVELRTLIKNDLELNSVSMMRENASALFEHHHHPLLAMQIESKEENIVTLLQINQFYQLCPTFSFKSTQNVGHIKLLEIETQSLEILGKQKQVTRLIGVTEKSSKDLKQFLKSYENLKKRRDHRVLGPQLKLFSQNDESNAFNLTWRSNQLS